MEKEDKRGIFFGVIGVLTLIVAIIGASFAYFSINAQSEEDALTVQAATVQIVYNDGESVAIQDIIPSTEEIALRAYTRAQGEGSSSYTPCIDDNNRTVCGVYEFTLTNEGTNAVNVTAKVTPTALDVEGGEVGFSNLNFIMYDITDDEESGSELHRGTMSYSEFNLFASEQSISGESTAKYRLFVWLNEAGADNDPEQGAIFKGTVKIDVPGAGSGQITGVAD